MITRAGHSPRQKGANMKTVDDVLSIIPSWERYIIESYWHNGVVYGASDEVRQKHVVMIKAKDDAIVICVDD